MKKVVNVFDGLKTALAEISLLILISEFESLVNTSGGTGGDGSAEDLAFISDNISLNSGVSSAVDDLTSLDL
jgi:hypothetical protein